jgi:hypothetical protein
MNKGVVLFILVMCRLIGFMVKLTRLKKPKVRIPLELKKIRMGKNIILDLNLPSVANPLRRRMICEKSIIF